MKSFCFYERSKKERSLKHPSDSKINNHKSLFLKYLFKDFLPFEEITFYGNGFSCYIHILNIKNSIELRNENTLPQDRN
jgi:hypothetical protein